MHFLMKTLKNNLDNRSIIDDNVTTKTSSGNRFVLWELLRWELYWQARLFQSRSTISWLWINHASSVQILQICFLNTGFICNAPCVVKIGFVTFFQTAIDETDPSIFRTVGIGLSQWERPTHALILPGFSSASMYLQFWPTLLTVDVMGY